MASPYKSRWGVWIPWADIAAHPLTFGLISEFMTSWDAGLAVLEAQPVPFTTVHQRCDEVVWGWCFAADVDGYQAGYLGDGTPIGINPMGAPQAQAVLPSHFMNEFVARVSPFAAMMSAKGGHLSGYIGPPNLGYVGDPFDWYKPLYDAGVRDIHYDSAGEIDPIRSPEMMAVLQDGYSRGVNQILEPFGTQAYEGRLAKYMPYSGGTLTLQERAALAYSASNWWLQYPAPKANIVLVYGNDRAQVIADSELWLSRGYDVRAQHYTLTADDMSRLTSLGRYPAHVYNRSRAALSYSSSTSISVNVSEKAAAASTLAGSTAVTNLRWDITQAGSGDPAAPLWQVQITPNLLLDGTSSFTVTVTPILGDGSSGPTQAAIFSHTQNFHEWQDAADHPQSQS